MGQTAAGKWSTLLRTGGRSAVPPLRDHRTAGNSCHDRAGVGRRACRKRHRRLGGCYRMGLGVHAAACDGHCGIGRGARHTGDIHVPRHAPVQGDGCLGGDRHHGEMGLGGSSEQAEPRAAGVPRDMDCCRSYRIDRCHLLCLLQSTGLGNFVGRCRRIHEIHFPGLRGFREALFQHDDKRYYDRSGQGKAWMVQVQGCCRFGRQFRKPSGHRPDQRRCREPPAGDHRRCETGCGQCRKSQGITRWNQSSVGFRTVAR